jgi:hypothetical protein
MRIQKKHSLSRNRIFDLDYPSAERDQSDRCLYHILDKDDDAVDVWLPDIWLHSHHDLEPENQPISFWSGVVPSTTSGRQWFSNEIVLETLRNVIRIEAERLLNDRLPAIRDEIRDEIRLNSFEETEVDQRQPADPVAEWCAQHRQELSEFPLSYVAIDLSSDSIVFSEPDEWNFARRLHDEERKANRKFAFVFTGMAPPV